MYSWGCYLVINFGSESDIVIVITCDMNVNVRMLSPLMWNVRTLLCLIWNVRMLSHWYIGTVPFWEYWTLPCCWGMDFVTVVRGHCLGRLCTWCRALPYRCGSLCDDAGRYHTNIIWCRALPYIVVGCRALPYTCYEMQGVTIHMYLMQGITIHWICFVSCLIKSWRRMLPYVWEGITSYHMREGVTSYAP